MDGQCAAATPEGPCSGSSRRQYVLNMKRGTSELGQIRFFACPSLAGPSCAVQGSINLTPAHFPGVDGSILRPNFLNLVVNAACPVQASFVDGGVTYRYSNIVSTGGRRIGGRDDGMLFASESGRVLVEESQGATGCPGGGGYCFRVRVFQDTSARKKRAVVGEAYSTGQVFLFGDITLDDRINLQDIAQVINLWGPCPAPCASDLNVDGQVNLADIAILINSWSS